jgi:hypothetical protein
MHSGSAKAKKLWFLRVRFLRFRIRLHNNAWLHVFFVCFCLAALFGRGWQPCGGRGAKLSSNSNQSTIRELLGRRIFSCRRPCFIFSLAEPDNRPCWYPIPPDNTGLVSPLDRLINSCPHVLSIEDRPSIQ